MNISGFSFVRNATKLYYPIRQSILSVLPLVGEFVVAVGKGDAEDRTRKEIESIGSPKIKIIDTEWDLEKYPHGTEYAHQTDIARAQCSGDWLFYLQGDEVLHEKYIEEIKNACQTYLENEEVEAFLFQFLHFWGDYSHYHNSHGWYPYEIRIIRNDPGIHSWNDAQSFRRFQHVDIPDYRSREGTRKLKVVKLNAAIYHYGWVRPPDLMQDKRKEFAKAYRGQEASEIEHKNDTYYFDYGPLSGLEKFNASHPAVMGEWIAKFNWKDKLQYAGPVNKDRPKHKHEKFKYRLLTFLEQKILRGRSIGGFKNYKIIRP